MSAPPLLTFVSAEEDRRFFVITYRTEAGDLGTVALGRHGERGTYRLASLSLGGRRMDETKTVDLLLRVDGAPTMEAFQVVDKDGPDLPHIRGPGSS